MSGPAIEPGAGLAAAVRIMDRLRSPGGCPWDAAQSHESLRRYLLEETYEVLEALDADDPVLLREELGDLLLQVLFHARIAAERVDGLAFDIDDVATDLVAKLTRRHPHVFGHVSVGGAGAPDAVQVERNWEQIKRAEKGRTSVLDGVVTAQPALARAATVLGRVRRAGLDVPAPSPAGVGGGLFALAARAEAEGIDPESALRDAVAEFAASVREREAAGGPAGAAPGGAPGE